MLHSYLYNPDGSFRYPDQYDDLYGSIRYLMSFKIEDEDSRLAIDRYIWVIMATNLLKEIHSVPRYTMTML